MNPLPAATAKLASETKFPEPDHPDDPNSTFTLTIKQGRAFDALLNAVIDYIAIEYARCGTQTTPTPSP